MVLHVPDTLPLATAAVLTCGGVTAFNAINNVRDSMEMNINILGLYAVFIILICCCCNIHSICVNPPAGELFVSIFFTAWN